MSVPTKGHAEPPGIKKNGPALLHEAERTGPYFFKKDVFQEESGFPHQPDQHDQKSCNSRTHKNNNTGNRLLALSHVFRKFFHHTRHPFQSGNVLHTAPFPPMLLFQNHIMGTISTRTPESREDKNPAVLNLPHKESQSKAARAVSPSCTRRRCVVLWSTRRARFRTCFLLRLAGRGRS